MQKKSAVLNALWWNIFFIMTRCEGKFFLFTANLCGNEISVTAYHYCWDIRLLNGIFQQLVARYTWKQFLHKNQRAVRVLNGFLNSKLENKLLLNPSKRKRCCVARRCSVTRVHTSGGLEVAGTTVKFGDFIKLLGVKLDPSISMDRHVTELVRSCN